MSEWWVYPNGINALSGLDYWGNPDYGFLDQLPPWPIEDDKCRGMDGDWIIDPDNPAVLDRETIIYFLRTIPCARQSFCRLYPKMTADERARLDWIAARANLFMRSHQDIDDSFQHAQNTYPPRTTGPRGGTGFRGGP